METQGISEQIIEIKKTMGIKIHSSPFIINTKPVIIKDSVALSMQRNTNQQNVSSYAIYSVVPLNL